MALAAFVLQAAAPSLNEFPGTDSRITYVGRSLAGPDGVTFDWSASGVRIRFTGTCLSVRVSDTDKDYYNLWIDHEPDAEADRVLAVAGKDTTIVLFDAREGLSAKAARKVKPAEHTIWLNKRTEGEQGKTTVHAVLTDGTLASSPASSRWLATPTPAATAARTAWPATPSPRRRKTATRATLRSWGATSTPTCT